LQDARIHIPRVRAVPDYHQNIEVIAPHPTFASVPGGALAQPYVRWHPPLPGMYDDNQPPEYDLDEADEAWLEKANAAAGAGAGGAGGGRGIMAAARGLYATVANRFLSSGGSEAPTPRASEADGNGVPPSLELGVTEFERAIEKLELLHFAAVNKWWNDVNDGGSRAAVPGG
jgi:hypothetical protein